MQRLALCRTHIIVAAAVAMLLASPALAGVTAYAGWDTVSGLPTSFWVRRPVRVGRPSMIEGKVRGRAIKILGDGPVQEALVEEIARQGGMLAMGDLAPDAVIDVASGVLETFA